MTKIEVSGRSVAIWYAFAAVVVAGLVFFMWTKKAHAEDQKSEPYVVHLTIKDETGKEVGAFHSAATYETKAECDKVSNHVPIVVRAKQATETYLKSVLPNPQLTWDCVPLSTIATHAQGESF